MSVSYGLASGSCYYFLEPDNTLIEILWYYNVQIAREYYGISCNNITSTIIDKRDQYEQDSPKHYNANCDGVNIWIHIAGSGRPRYYFY
jgi:hypothetical protein